MVDRSFGDAGARVVLEELLQGPEVSFFVIADGDDYVPLLSAQDHKRIFDNDLGPNTGGMGAFSPSPLMDAALQDLVERDIVRPVLRGMSAEGTPFRGFLYCGLMLTPDGPKVIEFNVRFGDPEAQVVLPLLDQPLAPLLWAAASPFGGPLRLQALKPSRLSAAEVLELSEVVQSAWCWLPTVIPATFGRATSSPGSTKWRGIVPMRWCFMPA